MRKLLLFILIPFFIYAQSAPSDSTGHIKLYQWSQGANPGATGLNNNWKKIDTAVSRGVWYPEWSGAVGNGTTDDAAAFGRAIDSARGKTLILTKPVYKIASKIEKDLADSSLTIISYSNSILYSTATVVTNDIEVPEGAFHLDNGGTINIIGVKFVATNPGSVNYLNALLITDCDRIHLDRVEASYAPYSGIRVKEANYLSVTDCYSHHNLYAGIDIENAKGGHISGGGYSYNGLTFPVNGYGITLSHRGGIRVDNEGFTIENVKSFYNLRKGIDLHGGVSCKIVNNHVKGFGNSGIYAVNEPGSDPDAPATSDTSWYKYVRDITIQGNTVENDSAWFVAQGSINASSGADGIGIFFGTYDDSTLAAGDFQILDNIVRHCNTPYARGHIFGFVALGEPLDAVTISRNKIHNAYVSPYWDDGAINLDGSIAPKLVDINNNFIDGTGDTCISVIAGDLVRINNNTINGTWNYPLAIPRDTEQKLFNNTLNDTLLMDMIDAFNGILYSELETGAGSATRDLLKINANGSTDGITNYEVKVVAVEAVANFYGTYYLNAIARNDAGTVNFSTSGVLRATGINGDPITYQPSLSWVGSGDIRTLRLTCSSQYTNYKITVNSSSWRLQQ
jgi:hypothetical protein